MQRLAGRRARVKLSHDERMRRLRLGDIRKLVRDRRGAILPDDDEGREYLKEILLPISLWPYEARMGRGRIVLMSPTDKMFCEIKNWAPWMSEQEAQELVDDINLTPEWQRKPTGGTLGKRLNLTYAERSRLMIKTIRCCDVTEAGMPEQSHRIAHDILMGFAENPDIRPEDQRAYRLIALTGGRQDLVEEDEQQSQFEVITGGAA